MNKSKKITSIPRVTLYGILFLIIIIASYSSKVEIELRITSSEKGATIFIDGKERGIVQISGATPVIVSQGRHQIRIFKSTKEWTYEGVQDILVDDQSETFFHIKTKSLLTQYGLDKIEKEINKSGFINHKNGTVTDTKTKLMWMRCTLGQTLDKNSNSCPKKINTYEWQEAQDIAKTLNFAGYSNWRVPSIQELNTLVYCSNNKQIKFEKNGYDSRKNEGGYGCNSDIRGDYQDPTIYTSVFPNTPLSTFWTSSLTMNTSDVWQVDFESGNDFFDRKDSPAKKWVRLVRFSGVITK